MKIHLAPMEGVVDHTMRALLTQIDRFDNTVNHSKSIKTHNDSLPLSTTSNDVRALPTQNAIDRCVTEFVRITDQLLPARVFYRYCPELKNEGRTPSGVPVYVQLLGGKPEPMAANAHKVANLGALGVDINFGCPAKQVNKNDGGSVILKEPHRVFDIVSQVRKAVPSATPVTAKIRLGFHDQSLFSEIANAVIEAGANELTIHARTKEDGYKPPAYWSAIAEIKAQSPIPIIANGEIWSLEDYKECVRQSGCEDVMLGRGVLACPDLARQIRSYQLLNDDMRCENQISQASTYSQTSSHSQVSVSSKASAHSVSDASIKKINDNIIPEMPWISIVDMLTEFSYVTEAAYEPKYVGNRIKQWLGYLRRQYIMAEILFESIKRLKTPSDILAAIELHKKQLLLTVVDQIKLENS